MHIDLTSLVATTIPKLAAAGVIALAASVLSTYTLRSDIQHLAVTVSELRSEVKEMRKDLYAPRIRDPQP